MRIIPLIFSFCFFCLLVAGCRDHPAGNNGNPLSGNPTSYVLTRQTFEHDRGTNGQSYFYTYNSDNMIAEIMRVQWGKYRENGGPEQTWIDTSYQRFEYRNNLPYIMWEVGSGESNVQYSYNADRLPSKRTVYGRDTNNLPIVFEYDLYNYDDKKNLIRVDTWRSDSLLFRYDLAYNDTGNLASVVRYHQRKTPNEKWGYTYDEHDTGVNFLRAVNGLPVTFEFRNTQHSYCSFCPNNPTLKTHNPVVPVGQPFVPKQPDVYSYEYNDEGLPVTMRYADGWTVTFEYRKFR